MYKVKTRLAVRFAWSLAFQIIEVALHVLLNLSIDYSSTIFLIIYYSMTQNYDQQ